MNEALLWPDPPLRSSQVAIVGFATETMGLAPFDDPQVEIWILNMLHHLVPRWDRIWELHNRATLEQESTEGQRGTDHLAALQAERDRPIYMVEAWPDIPQSRRFPVEVLTTHFGASCRKLHDKPYFTSTFAYMLLTAVLGIVQRRTAPWQPEPGEAIHVCGIELLNGDEYAYQRSCAEFYLGVALGHGIEVVVPDRSALLESDGLYGYANGESLELLTRMRAYHVDQRAKMLAKRDEAATRRDQAKADWNSYDGAIKAFDHVISHHTYLARGGKV